MRAGIGYALAEATDGGHCGLPADELGPLAARLLDVPGDAIRTGLELELAQGAIVADTVADAPCALLGHVPPRVVATIPSDTDRFLRCSPSPVTGCQQIAACLWSAARLPRNH